MFNSFIRINTKTPGEELKYDEKVWLYNTMTSIKKEPFKDTA